jgi:AcrR family transcriptional regulator
MPFVADVRGEPALGLRERKKKRTRATLIDAAVDLCQRQGFERTTVDQIAAVADVSPRTFSRYFATKDAIATALIDEAIDNAAVELERQPRELGHFEALRRAYVQMYRNTESAPPGELSAERTLSTIRIVMTSPTLRLAAHEYRPRAVNVELAKRLGLDVEHRTVQLISAVWGTIIITALSELADDPQTDWERVGVEDVVSHLEATYAEFAGLMAGFREAV